MKKTIFYNLMIGFILLAACAPKATAVPTATPVPQTPTPTTPPPTATPVPRAMTICLGQEPSSLYLYAANRSQSTWSVLEAIYDGPIDYVNYQYQPVILEKIPSLADGDAKLEAVTVKQGMPMVDADGNLRTLQKDVPYFPSGCNGADCKKTYDGKGDVQMDQMTVQFKLKAGLTWSDGTPLKASDSVYSFNLAGNAATSGNKDLVKKTDSYTATDDTTVVWKGVPGFMDQQYMARFWIPQPEHLFSGKDPATLADDPMAKEKPLGWGPYVISEWKAGDHIQLTKNPSYFRAAEGLPKMDILNYRFLSDASQQSMEALLTGECDVVDESTLLDDQLKSIKDLQSAGKLKAAISGSVIWEGLDFGIKPSLYDTVPAAYNKTRPDFFNDARMRQAVSMCINKQRILDEVWSGYSAVPGTFLANDNPLALKNGPDYSYSPEKANALLDQLGWKDYDNNPSTPRVAVTVPNGYLGVSLTFKYYTTNAEARKKVASMVASDLAGCGIGVDVRTLSADDLFANGPDGVLFGRKFDLAEFSWGPSSMPACRFYTSQQIGSQSNEWTGINVSGYSSKDFDAACQSAAAAIPGQADYEQKQQAVQTIYASDLPVIPLYQTLRIGLSRPDLCGYSMDATSRSGLWNIEKMDYGSTCQ